LFPRINDPAKKIFGRINDPAETISAGSMTLPKFLSGVIDPAEIQYCQFFRLWERCSAFGNGVEVLHGLPLVLGGIGDAKGVLALIDFLNWSNDVHCSRDIIDTRKKCLELIKEMSKGDTPLASSVAGSPLAPAGGSLLAPLVHTVPPLPTVKYHLSLPADLDKKNNKIFKAVQELPVKLHTETMSQEAACDILNMLVSELNVKFTTDLGSITAFDTACSDSDTEPEKTTIIFVGGSHSGRLAAAAGGNGVEVVNLSMPGFRVCEETIDTACIY
jgi:hypothetical protein